MSPRWPVVVCGLALPAFLAACGSGGDDGGLEYVLAAELPALDSTAVSWTFGAAPDDADLEVLSTALGLGGAPAATEPPGDGDGGQGRWRVGEPPGPTLFVDVLSPGTWTFADESGPCFGGPTDEGGGCPSPPLSATADALAAFDALVRAIGVDPTNLDVEPLPIDDRGTQVVGTLQLDGVRSPPEWTATYAYDGSLALATGVVFDAGRADARFPRIGAEAGFERLQAGNDPTRARALPCEGFGCSGFGTGPVEIVGVEETYVTIFDDSDLVRLLPAYAFIAADGSRHVVSAVPAEYVTDPADNPPETIPGVVTRPCPPGPQPVCGQPVCAQPVPKRSS